MRFRRLPWWVYLLAAFSGIAIVQIVDIVTDNSILRLSDPSAYWNEVALAKHYLISTNMYQITWLHSLSSVEVIWLKNSTQLVMTSGLDFQRQLIAIDYLIHTVHGLPPFDEIMKIIELLKVLNGTMPAELIVQNLADLNNHNPFQRNS